MDQNALVIDQIETGRAFLAEFAKYMPIQCAFWLKEQDKEYWNLYVASKQITDDNFDVAYGEVLEIAKRINDPLFDPFQVKVIGADDPVAKAACGLVNGPNGVRFRGPALAGIPVEAVYVYPSSIALPAA